jgi:hypothetical protein
MAEATLIAGATDAATAVIPTDASKAVADAASKVAATDGAAKVAATDGSAPDAAKVAADAAAKTAADTAAAEVAKAKTGAPEKYEAFKLPDGVKLEDAQIADLQATAKDLNLTQDQAQKLVDRELKVRADVGAAAQTEFKSTVSGWADQARADKDIGGDKLPAVLASAKRGVDTMEAQVPGLKLILDTTGFGNHPVAIKVFQKIGAMTGEDGKFLQGGAKPADKNSEAAVAQRMYPTMTKTA